MTRELKGWHVLTMLLCFFGVTIAVNVAMSYYAIRTFSGEDVSTPYMRGLAYNETLRERATQAKRGWRAELGVRRNKAGTASIEVHIADRDAAPLSGLKVSATLRRPTNAALDRTITLAARGGGRYAGDVAGVLPGQWDVSVSAANGDAEVFEADRRVVMP